MADSDHATCPRCGARISPVEPTGLCPRCLVASDVAHYNRGVALQAQGNLDEAIAEYRAAIRLEPDFAEAHSNLGDVLTDQGKEEAIDEYRAVIRIDPDDAVAHSNLGTALRDQGKLEEAIAEFRKARDNAQRGSKLAQLIERALSAFDH